MKRALQKTNETEETIEDQIALVSTSTVSKLLFQQIQIDGVDWTIFWVQKDATLGVTDGETMIYEKQLSIVHRRELAGNVSTDLLTDKWRKVFENRAFTLNLEEDEYRDIEVKVGQNLVKLTRDRFEMLLPDFFIIVGDQQLIASYTEKQGHISAIFNETMAESINMSKEIADTMAKNNGERIHAIATKRRYPPRPEIPAKSRPIDEGSSDTIEKIDEVSAAIDSKLFLQRKHIDGVSWTVFWRHADETLGVTDGETKLYENKLSIDKRRELAGNVNASLLADKWKKLFENRAFTPDLSEDENGKIEVNVAQESVQLSLVEESGHISRIFNEIVNEFVIVFKEYAEMKAKENAEKVRGLATKRRCMRPEYHRPAKTRRVREFPTGLQFPDDDGEEN